MPSLTLLAGAAYGASAALVYGLVAYWVSQRKASSREVELAGGLYATWWAGVATTAMLGAIGNVLGAAGIDDVGIHIGLNYLKLLGVCAAIWGLLYYVVYLLWGNGGRALSVLTIFYTTNFLLVLVHLTLARPSAVHVGRWQTSLVLSGEWAPAQSLAWGVLVYAPLLLAIIGYFTVYFRAPGATVRYRVVAVSVTVLLWFESLLLSRTPSLAENDTWQVTTQLAMFFSSLLVLLAYQPPSWLARRWPAQDAAIAESDPSASR